MASPALAIDDLLAPISEERPAGEDITLAPEWQTINQARRRDKLSGRLNSDWPAIQQLLSEALAHKSKDLRLAIWLTEANIVLHGFDGLRDSARLLRGLINQYWDAGLYPEVEAGDLQFRAMPLAWLGGDNLPRVIRQVPLTARSGGGRNYSYADYRQSGEIGWEKDTRNSLGDPDPNKEEKRRSALAAGGVSGEAFEEAVKASKRAGIELISVAAEAAWAEFQALDQTIEEKFGQDGPGTSEAREAMDDCRQLLAELVKRKRLEEPDPVTGQQAVGDNGNKLPGQSFSFSDSSGSTEPEVAGSWLQAEEMVRRGKVQEGLGQMALLSAAQHGRIHFQHRLRLAELCLGIGREKMAIAILEELAKSVDELHLDKWESPALLGRVWGRLYRCYKTAEPGSEASARGKALFDRLCRLDPWQALGWDE